MGRSITNGQIFLVCFCVETAYKSTFIIPPPDNITTQVQKENTKIRLYHVLLNAVNQRKNHEDFIQSLNN